MPVLSLPHAIINTKNDLLPTTVSMQTPSTSNLQHPHPVNPVSTLALGEQHFTMPVIFHPMQLTTNTSPTHRHILPECNSVLNSNKSMLHCHNHLYRSLIFQWPQHESCLCLTLHQVRPTSNMGFALPAISFTTLSSLSCSWCTKCATSVPQYYIIE